MAQFLRVKVPPRVFTAKCSEPQAAASNDRRGGKAAEIEYCIGADYQGNGYAGEALSAIIDYAFSQTDFKRLEAYHRAENPRSGKVLEKSCMLQTDMVERFRRAATTEHKNEVCYAITADEWMVKER